MIQAKTTKISVLREYEYAVLSPDSPLEKNQK